MYVPVGQPSSLHNARTGPHGKMWTAIMINYIYRVHYTTRNHPISRKCEVLNSATMHPGKSNFSCHLSKRACPRFLSTCSSSSSQLYSRMHLGEPICKYDNSSAQLRDLPRVYRFTHVRGGALEHTVVRLYCSPGADLTCRAFQGLQGFRTASSPTTIIEVSYGNKKEKGREQAIEENEDGR
jgi:hypothetical protein